MPPLPPTPGIVEGCLPGHYAQIAAQNTYPGSWLAGQFEDFAEWRAQTRQTLRAALLMPESHRPFQPRLVDDQPRGSYRARKIHFNITDESRVPALLLRPNRPGPRPAVLLLHDHGAEFSIGKEKLIRPWGDRAQLAAAHLWADRYYSGRFIGDELAKRGYVVLAVDMRGWGERGPLSYEQQQALACNYFCLGRSLAGEVAYEDMRALAFLASLSGVDPQRVGVLGFSLGGFRAWQLAALSEQAAATAALGWFGSYPGLIAPGNNLLRGQSAFYTVHPGIPAQLDIPDIAALAAPRPLLLINGEEDAMFPPEAVRAGYEKVARVWASQQVPERLDTCLWPGLGHRFDRPQQQAVFEWFERWLKP